jgi:hypothetical protein
LSDDAKLLSAKNFIGDTTLLIGDIAYASSLDGTKPLIIFPGGNLYELIACEKINNSNNI